MLRVVAGGSFVYSLYFMVVSAVFLTRRTTLLPLLTITAGATNVILNLVLIPRVGVMGAAWSTLVGYLVLAVGTALYARRGYPLRVDLARIVVLAAVGAALVVAARVALPVTPSLGAFGLHALAIARLCRSHRIGPAPAGAAAARSWSGGRQLWLRPRLPRSSGRIPPTLAGDRMNDDRSVRIHPTADVSPSAEIGSGTSIWNQSQVRERARIGPGCVIGKNVYVDFDVVIGANVKIQNNVSVYHGVTIEDGVFIGPHVCFTNDRIPRAINPDGSLKSDDDWEVSPDPGATWRRHRREQHGPAGGHHRPLGHGRLRERGHARRGRSRAGGGEPGAATRQRLRLRRPASRRGGWHRHTPARVLAAAGPSRRAERA